MNSPPEIDADAVIVDLQSLRQIGRDRTGVSRPAYSNADMEARRWVAARMREIGLVISTDGVGNVVGPRSASSGARFSGIAQRQRALRRMARRRARGRLPLETARAWKAASPDVGIDESRSPTKRAVSSAVWVVAHFAATSPPRRSTARRAAVCCFDARSRRRA